MGKTAYNLITGANASHNLDVTPFNRPLAGELPAKQLARTTNCIERLRLKPTENDVLDALGHAKKDVGSSLELLRVIGQNPWVRLYALHSTAVSEKIKDVSQTLKTYDNVAMRSEEKEAFAKAIGAIDALLTNPAGSEFGNGRC